MLVRFAVTDYAVLNSKENSPQDLQCMMFAQAERSLVCELIRRVYYLACSSWFHAHHKLISNTSKK